MSAPAAETRLREQFPEPWKVWLDSVASRSDWRATVMRGGVSLLGVGPTPDAAVDALLAAWREATAQGAPYESERELVRLLAASQARERELREAGEQIVRTRSCISGDDEARLLSALASRPDDAALREVCERVAHAAMCGDLPFDGTEATGNEAARAAVDSVLGPAQEGGGE